MLRLQKKFLPGNGAKHQPKSVKALKKRDILTPMFTDVLLLLRDKAQGIILLQGVKVITENKKPLKRQI